MKTIQVGMIGFGGIARLHKNAYDALFREGKGIKLVAVCDRDPSAFEKESTINISNDNGVQPLEFNKYTDLDTMLQNEELDMIDICLPTPLHARFACDMLSRGYNVLSEKPMARTYEDCVKMLEASKKSGKHLMIGQCVRFDSDYCYLRKLCREKTYGNVKSAEFYRLSCPPLWAGSTPETNWFLNTDKSGGCLLDMHIHDIDFILGTFGEPKDFTAVQAPSFAKYDYCHTRLYYDGFAVEATGDWGLAPKFPFSCGYRVNFDSATVELKDGKVTVYPYDSDAFTPDYEKRDFMLAEIEYYAEVLHGDHDNIVNPADTAAETVKLIEEIRAYCDKNEKH